MNAPAHIGRYEVIRRLGLGGMAEVFLVRRVSRGGFEKTLVIKRLLPHLSQDPRMVEQLEREARIGALLNHPNLVHTFDLDVDERGSPFIVLEHVDGQTLKDVALSTWQRGVPLPIELSVGAVASAALGLHHLHEARDGDKHLELVHRDVSPDNLMLEDDGTVRVMDFGVARMGSATVALTAEGELKGKIPFMPPEQLRGEEVDRRCDIYALGVTLYWMLTGSRPFEDGSDLDGSKGGLNPAVVIQRALHDPVSAVTTLNGEVPASLEDVVMQMLAKDREGRFATAAEVHDQLLNAVPVARFATQQFVREARAHPAEPEKKITATVPARMLTVQQRRFDIAPESASPAGGDAAPAKVPPPTPTSPEGRAEVRPPTTVSEVWSPEQERARKLMWMSAASGAALALCAAGIGSLLFASSDDDLLRQGAPLPVATADSEAGGVGSEGTDAARADLADEGEADGEEPDGDEDESEVENGSEGQDRKADDDDAKSQASKRQASRRERPRGSARAPVRPRASARPAVRTVKLVASRNYDWLVAGKTIGTGRLEVELPSDRSSVEAMDKRHAGYIAVPIIRGVADVNRVRRGKLDVKASGLISGLRLGLVPLPGAGLFELTAGRYLLSYTEGRRAKSREVRIGAGRTTRVLLP